MTSKREDREALIEEAAKAMYFEDCGVAALEDDAEPFREMARVALGVFEQAHTPTDDEREASIEEVAAAFQQHEGAPTWKDNPVARDAALRWHMRGFKDGLNARRPVQGEPTDAAAEAEANRRWPHVPGDPDASSARSARRLSFRQGVSWAHAAAAVTEQGGGSR